MMRSFLGWLWNLTKAVFRWFRNVVWPWYRALSRRMQIIVGCVTGVLLISCCAFGAMNSNANTDTNSMSQQANQNGGSSTTAHVSATATNAATANPTAAPVATQPVSHPPTATTPPAPKYPAINGNPYDLTLVNTGHLVYNPPGDICHWLNCIASFWHNTNGYVDLCNDGTYSHSGGVQGACSKHGYEKQPVYQP